MVNRFTFAPKPGETFTVPLPDITLDWNTEDDTLIFTVNGKALPTMTMAEAAGLFAAMGLLNQKAEHDQNQGDAGATEGPRPEQAGPRVPDVGV